MHISDTDWHIHQMVAWIFILGQMLKDLLSLEPCSFRTRKLALLRMLNRASASSDTLFCKIDSNDIYYINKCAHIRHRLAYAYVCAIVCPPWSFCFHNWCQWLLWIGVLFLYQFQISLQLHPTKSWLQS